MATTSSTPNYVAFPKEGQCALDEVYNARKLGLEETAERIKALREEFHLGNMVVAATGGINSEEELLRALEFYVLQTRGYLKDEEEFLDED